MIVYSWDGNATVNDDTNFAAYFVGPELGLPEMQANMVARNGAHPLIGGVTRQGLELLMEVEVLEGSADTLRAWFDPEDETPKVLVVTDEDGTNARYWRALCTSFMPTVSPYIFLAKLRVHGDVRLRSVAPTTAHWDVTASGATTSVTNGTAGVNDDAYPIVTVTPRGYATGQNNYRRFVTVRWRASAAASQYPVDIVNAGLDTRTASTHFASATGNDIRLQVDGVETDFWLSGINTATTKLYCNLDWMAAQSAPLASSVGAGSLTSLTVTGDITNFPGTGILEIDSELFTYTAKDNALKRFSGLTRAAKGTTAASHSAAATVRWIQHDIWIEYGSATLAAFAVDDSYKPMFLLSGSSNTSWDYDDFYAGGASRAGAWTYSNFKYTTGYGGNRTAAADPYGELGIADASSGTKTALDGAWTIYNPCGITGANFQNGEFWHGRSDWWGGKVRTSADGAAWVTAYSIPTGTNATWTSWSQNVSPAAGSKYVQLALQGYASTAKRTYVEAADVTLTLDSSYTPTVAIGAEQSTYRLQATITNETTGDALEVDLSLDLDESLEIDTDTHEVTLLTDNSPQYQALTLVGGTRRHLLRLQPGSNTLKYEESGLSDVDIDIEFERRFRA